VKELSHGRHLPNLVPRTCDRWEGMRGSGIIRCRKPGILAKIELRIPFQQPIRFLPETDYPRASRSFPRIAGSGNEIAIFLASVVTCAHSAALGNLRTQSHIWYILYYLWFGRVKLEALFSLDHENEALWPV
jgi:hypothetical protein